MARRNELQTEVEGRTLRLSNLDKVLYPKTGFTKGDLIDYYVRIAPVLLPHLADRPLTLKRYPNGVEGGHFYEKRCPAFRPDWLLTRPIWSEGNADFIEFCVVNDLPSLVWLANLADLEIHTYLHRVPRKRERSRAELMPTVLVFDLDPGPPADIVQCCQVAVWIRALLESLGLEAWPKTSGSKGMQLYVPINTKTTYEDTKRVAHAIAEIMEREHPDAVVSRMSKALRTGKVFVDWSQNDDHKTTVSVWSLRANETPTVSTPVEWEEVERCLRTGKPERLVFPHKDALARAARGDLFAPVLTRKQTVPTIS